MILTVTLNPALDITYTVDAVVAGTTHRVRAVAVRPGGKGLNVARRLGAQGIPTVATGLIGGHNGARITGLLAADAVTADFVPVAGESRRTIVVTDNAEATGFWEPGPGVTAAEWRSFLAHYRQRLADAAIVVLAGSLPAGVPDEAYAVLVAVAGEAGVGTVLDADGPWLAAGLAAEPTVVKPNAAELTAVTGQPITGPAEALAAARALRGGGPTAVVASLGDLGLVATTADGEWHASLGTPLTGNPTGAGDACVAALAAGLADRCEWPGLLAEAVAWSGAAVVAPTAGVVDPAHIARLRPDVTVEEIR